MSQEGNRKPTSGVDEFFELLKSYSKLLTWTFGAAVVPLAAGMAKLAPPWPPAILQLTTIFEVLIVILVFQNCKASSSETIKKIMYISISMFTASLVAYLCLLSIFTFEEPISGKSFVKGFICTPEATAVFTGKCPFFGDDDLRTAEWEAGRLWTNWSIAFMRISIVSFWISMFSAMAAAIGSFLVYQSGVKARTL